MSSPASPCSTAVLTVAPTDPARARALTKIALAREPAAEAPILVRDRGPMAKVARAHPSRRAKNKETLSVERRASSWHGDVGTGVACRSACMPFFILTGLGAGTGWQQNLEPLTSYSAAFILLSKTKNSGEPGSIIERQEDLDPLRRDRGHRLDRGPSPTDLAAS